jgi:arabinofuranan 3-O-arabinosyltransferase
MQILGARASRPGVRGLFTVASIAVIAVSLMYNLAKGPERFGWTDFQSFYTAALTLLQGGDPYAPALSWIATYVPTGNGALFGTRVFVYAPFFALMMVPLTLLGPFGALVLWDLCNVGFLLGAVNFGLRAAGVRPSAPVVLGLTAAFSATEPIHKEWFLGQSDVLLLFLICLALWTSHARGRVMAGAVLGIALAIKPALAIILVFLLWKREFRLVVAAVTVGTAALLAPFLWLGPRALSEQLTVWAFWSNQFLAQAHNDSLKGVLARLFTVNPVVHPVLVAPALVTAGWLLGSLVVTAITLAVVSPAPLRRDAVSLIEVGLMVEAFLLITPLMEWPYLLLLTVPLLGSAVWLWERASSGRKGWKRQSAGVVAIWALLLGPAGAVEYALLNHVNSSVGAIIVVVAPVYLYAVVAAFAMQVHVLDQQRTTTLRAAVGTLMAASPSLFRTWVADARSALGLAEGN